ncbi:MAG TPA: tetratricopeptide repeat protein [Blastocatellia bacterium]|nr:tetratricopeptide repeat protein [Blastocatellia bacterium]
MKKLFFVLLTSVWSATVAFGQEFEIKQYDVKANVKAETREVEVQAKMRLVNLSGRDLADKVLLSTGNKPRLSFYLHNKAKVSAMTVNGAAVQFKTGEPLRLPLITVATDITTAFASAPEFDVELAYTIPSADRSQTLHVSTGESYALPNGFWVPVNHNPYADHGADSAPFTLTVTAAGKVISSGNRTGDNSFEQTLATQPFFFVGNHEVTTVTAAKSAKIELYAPRGLDENGKQQSKRLTDEATKIVNFFTDYFGIPQPGAFRIIALGSLGLTFSEPGAVVIDDSFFRRNVLDLGTIELLAGAVAKSFIDGRVLMRGRGAGMMRDGLPIYLVAQYLGSRFGEAQATAALDRYRRAYEPVARGSDSALLLQSPYDRSYTTVVYNKGALVWRLLEKKIGKQAFDNLVRQMLDRQRVDVLSLVEWKAPLCRVTRCTNVKAEVTAAAGAQQAEVQDIFTQWIENVIVPDFAVGQPQAGANGVESTLVNFGSGDLTVEVMATTEAGEKLKQNVAIKGGEYGAVTFPAGTKIARIEVDPDKLYPQKDYANDVFPRRVASPEIYGQASLAFTKKDYATAETKLKEALSAEPNAPILQSLLGRVLLATNKNDEAARVFAETIKSELLPLQAYAWSQLGLGQLALQNNKPAEALAHFRFAAASDLDQTTTLVARDGAIKADANASKVPDDVKAFLKQLDDALLTGSADAVNPLVEQGNLREFVKRVTGSKPSLWTTEILRTEAWDAERIAVDVQVKVKIIGREGAGRAVYLLSRAGGKLKLSEVPIFDVK